VACGGGGRAEAGGGAAGRRLGAGAARVCPGGLPRLIKPARAGVPVGHGP